ncbi:MAG: hypothetical protein B7Y49_09860, partial [Sphingomonas sp. 28-62-11]
MIALDDPRWERLSHAYGSAADIPELLRQLAGATGPIDVLPFSPPLISRVRGYHRALAGGVVQPAWQHR